MSGLCIWSEEALSNRHPRYKAFFAKRDRSRSTTSTPRSRSRANTHEGEGTRSETSTPGTAFETQTQETEEMVKEVDESGNGNNAPNLPLRERTQSSPPPPLPAAPQPSADEAIHEVNAKVVEELETKGKPAVEETIEVVDIWAMRPVQAMELLSVYVQSLVSQSGQKLPKPPTPPSSSNSSKSASPTQTPAAIDENRRPSHDRGLAPPSSSFVSPGPTSPQHPFLQRVPRASRTPIDSPISHPQSPIPPTHPASPSPLPLDKRTHIIAQSDKLARKFYCKSAPPVALSEYLTRLHTFCPASVAVYLAAGVYIERLTRKRSTSDRRGSFLPLTPVSSNSQEAPLIDEILAEAPEAEEPKEDAPLVEVTPKSVHRLLLAALRVAQKALEDGVFPHRRVALVGGVSELELSRLEVSMCFLTDFELVLKLRDMERWVRKVRALEKVRGAG